MSGWQVLLNSHHYTYYHWKYHPGLIEYAALIIDVLLLTAVFWAAMSLVRHSGNKLALAAAQWAFLLSLVVPINNLRLQLFDPLNPSSRNRWGGALLMAIFLSLLLTAVVLKRHRQKIIKGTATVVLILFPFFLVAMVQGAWLTIKYRTNVELSKTELVAPPLNSSKQGVPRVVLVVFDELDQRRAFGERMAGLELPEFDRLRKQAIFVSNAYPPASETLLSLPSLTIGKQVSAALPTSPVGLRLTLKGSNEEVDWGTLPNMFSSARADGFDTALVGWYHPYCRVLGNSLTSCFWQPVVDAISPLRGKPTIAKSMSHWAESALFSIPGMFRVLENRYERERAEAHIEEYLLILEHAKKVVGQREYGLTLLHFPIPHHPFIYDRSRNALSSSPDRKYEDNLVLADWTLGELRRQMEAAGLWQDTAIIVTSDHCWRTPPDRKIDQRVPFLLKVAQQKEGATYDGPFNSVITSELIHALLKSQLSAPACVALIDRLGTNRLNTE